MLDILVHLIKRYCSQVMNFRFLNFNVIEMSTELSTNQADKSSFQRGCTEGSPPEERNKAPGGVLVDSL